MSELSDTSDAHFMILEALCSITAKSYAVQCSLCSFFDDVLNGTSAELSVIQSNSYVRYDVNALSFAGARILESLVVANLLKIHIFWYTSIFARQDCPNNNHLRVAMSQPSSGYNLTAVKPKLIPSTYHKSEKYTTIQPVKAPC